MRTLAFMREFHACQHRRLKEEVAAERERADRAGEAAAAPAEAQHKREDTAAKKNPVLVYVEKLAASDESAWKDFLDGMGTGPDIPKLFRHAGKVGSLWDTDTSLHALSAY